MPDFVSERQGLSRSAAAATLYGDTPAFSLPRDFLPAAAYRQRHLATRSLPECYRDRLKALGFRRALLHGCRRHA